VLAFLEFGKTPHGLAVAADFGMAEVHAGHQHAARRGADGRAGVVAGEPGTFGGELVEMRGADLLLSVTSKFAIAEVVGDDEDNVFRGGGDGGALQGDGGDGGA
jgi:hypothetical protein